MKKIMKKALSLALALVMVLSLAPVTAQAATEGTMSNPHELVVDGTVISFTYDTEVGAIWYSYEATTSGVLTFKAEGNNDWVVPYLYNNGSYTQLDDFDFPCAGTTTKTLSVEAGSTYRFKALTSSMANGEVAFSVTLTNGTMDNPYNLVADGTKNSFTYDTEVGAIWYSYEATTSGILTFKAEGNNDWVVPYLYNNGSYTQLDDFDFPCAGTTTKTLSVEAGSTYRFKALTSSMANGEVAFSVTFAEGTSSGETDEETGGEEVTPGTTPETALSIAMYNQIYAGQTTYYKTNVESGKAYVVTLYNPSGTEVGLYAYNPMNQSYVFCAETTNGLLEMTLNANSSELTIGVASQTEVYIRIMIEEYVEEEEEVITTPGSSYDNPEVVTELGTITQDTPSGESYWYKWTATEDGVFTVTTSTEDARASVFTVNDEYDYVREDLENGRSVMVEQGDDVVYYVNPSGLTSANITTAFVAGATIEVEEELEENDVNYVESDDLIVVGENELTVSNNYPYTVFTFEPVSTGSYTLASEDSLMGIVSTNGMWVTVTPSAETVSSEEIEWKCTSVGQSIMVAVLAETNVANIIVEREELEVVVIPTTNVSVSPETYVFTGNVSNLTYVDVEGTTTDKVVKGEDGFYHLNSEDGPILLVNLSDSIISFVLENDSLSIGKLAVSVYEDGKVVKYITYGDAVNTYIACADVIETEDYGTATLYPLTDELIEVYKTYGAQQGWYDAENGGYVVSQFSKYNAEDVWMFACMYVPNAEDGSIVVPPVVVTPEVNEEGKVEAIEKDELEVAIESAKDEGRDLVIQTSNEKVTIVIANEDLAEATVMELDVTVETVADVKDETVAKAEEITADNFVLKVEFAHDGKLPAKVEISIEVGEAYANKTLYYYEILADGTLKYVCDAPVDANGNAKVAQDHCSDYVLLTEKLVADTGDNTNIALWFAVLGLGVVAIAGSVVMRKREF